MTVLNEAGVRYVADVLQWLKTEPKCPAGFNMYVTSVVLEDDGEPLGSVRSGYEFWLFESAT